MKTVRVTLDLVVDDTYTDTNPEEWKWDRMLYLIPSRGESAVVVSVEEQS